jgi:hypothetical protein
MHISLGVDEVAFDIPQAVLAFVALAFDGAGVFERAGGGGRQGHDADSGDSVDEVQLM